MYNIVFFFFRTYITERTDLSTNGYAKWVSQRVAEIGKIL